MQRILLIVVSFIAITFTNLNAANFKAAFSDPALWNGKIVPEEMVCSNYNFDSGSTPEITLSNIPKKTDKIILVFSDETFKPMSDGGHGIISYRIDPGLKTIIIPSMQGETFDLPDEFTSLIPHKGVQFGKAEGAYLAPCSGGKKNTYSVIIQAVDKDNNVLDSTSLTLGKF
ncbi:MAG: hypothetical protein WA945_00645 [Arcobacteraceae bacterium]